MIELTGVGVLAVLYLMLLYVSDGYANMVDRTSLFLHRHAEKVRRRHAVRTEQMRQMWVQD
jgi:hypothetical protein